MPHDTDIKVIRSDSTGIDLTIPYPARLTIKRQGVYLNFTMLINNKVPSLIKLMQGHPPRTILFFLGILSKMRIDGVACFTVDQIGEVVGIQPRHVYRHIKALREVDLIRKVEKDMYQVNPNYAWWGATNDRAEAVHNWNNGIVILTTQKVVATRNGKK